eukprot:scaffold4827_cov48-Phaeocystis_antarctica.AAC.2
MIGAAVRPIESRCGPPPPPRQGCIPGCNRMCIQAVTVCIQAAALFNVLPASSGCIQDRHPE